MYLLSDQSELYVFATATRSATRIAALSCTMHPVSMAVSRGGDGWVLSDEGRLYRLDLGTGACSATTFAPGQHHFFKFGMGFAADVPGGERETLYVSGDLALGALDTARLEIAEVAPTSLPASELTGTADGNLYLFSGSSGRLTELDKSTGSPNRSFLNIGLTPAANFAAAAWRDELWLFTETRANVYQLRSDVLEPAVELGFRTVGAGVSTCASGT